jgi:hypothetical protein
MSFTPFTLADTTVVYLDSGGKIQCTLLGTRTVTVDSVDDKQALAELLLANAPDNFVLNEANLLYQVESDHNVVFGAGAIPIDRGSASPSISVSASPSAS